MERKVSRVATLQSAPPLFMLTPCVIYQEFLQIPLFERLKNGQYLLDETIYFIILNNEDSLLCNLILFMGITEIRVWGVLGSKVNSQPGMEGLFIAEVMDYGNGSVTRPL